MKPFSIIIVAIAFISFSIACKKNVSTPPLPINDTLIDTVDIREQYKGVFEVRIDSRDWITGSFRLDTIYTTSLRIDCNREDSMMGYYDFVNKKPVIFPQITLYYPDDSVYYKLGVDKNGKIYNNWKASVPVFYGGFVDKDSMNFVFGFIGNHEGRLDTVRGHRIK